MHEDVSALDESTSDAIQKQPSGSEPINNVNKKIRWADTSGGQLLTLHEIEGKNGTSNEPKQSSVTSWSDQRKRDRDHEKLLFEKARKSKLIDTEDNLDTMVMMHNGWHPPVPLPPDSESPPVKVESQELYEQKKRTASALSVSYLTEDDVPSNPVPLTDAEQAMEMSSQSSSVSTSIPFFAFQQTPLPTPTPAPLPAPPIPPVPAPALLAIPPAPVLPPALPIPPPIAPPTTASAEIVQAMGLPPFLVGQNLQALQTIAATPGLLKAFVDVNGNYDQLRILTLVQTLTQNQASSQVAQAVPAPPNPYQNQQAYGQTYGTTQPPPQSNVYGNNSAPRSSTSTYTKTGYRGDQNGNEGNLHISGFGPSVTPEAVRVLFSPYVKVDEIVPKNGFMFVNTADAEGAKRAREALNGVMLGGSALRINLALRRTKNPNQAAAHSGPIDATPLPMNVLGQVDYDNVRDDRGNPATKNLFVAGYGAGTTEQELKNIFNQHTQVSSIVIKGNFAFVNTIEKKTAVSARQALIGATINGGILRINFAKESGRLGTSFDSGYSSKQAAQTSYYGRGY